MSRCVSVQSIRSQPFPKLSVPLQPALREMFANVLLGLNSSLWYCHLADYRRLYEEHYPTDDQADDAKGDEHGDFVSKPSKWDVYVHITGYAPKVRASCRE
jgi:hypothetical protein